MSCRMLRISLMAGAGIIALCDSPGAWAHGFAGARFFPATLATDDPFVAEEMSLPTVAWSRDNDGTKTTAYSADWAKRITTNFGVAIGATFLRVSPPGGPNLDGFDNLALGLKYQLVTDPMEEFILSVGIDIDIGGTGATRVGAEKFSRFTPGIFFGKGLTGLPDQMSWMRGFGVTGSVGVSIPEESRTQDEFGDFGLNPDILKLGFALEYSVPYLQSQVRNIGLSAPFDRLIPLVELAVEKPFNRGGGPWTGTVNPGIAWAGQYVQLTAEAAIPVNAASGHVVGFIAQLHFYIDDLFPNTLGRPLF